MPHLCGLFASTSSSLLGRVQHASDEFVSRMHYAFGRSVVIATLLILQCAVLAGSSMHCFPSSCFTLAKQGRQMLKQVIQHKAASHHPKIESTTVKGCSVNPGGCGSERLLTYCRLHSKEHTCIRNKHCCWPNLSDLVDLWPHMQHDGSALTLLTKAVCTPTC